MYKNKNYKKEYYQKNKEKICLRISNYRKNNIEKLLKREIEKSIKRKDKIKVTNHLLYIKKKDSILSKNKEWREKNQEKILLYKVKNKGRDSIKNKEYHQKNKEKINKRKLEYKKNNINAHLTSILRARLYAVLKGKQKVGSAVTDLGCTIEELKLHLEAQFQTGMTWVNWGHQTWHVDHIKPLASFDLTKREQFLEAFNYTNLQPMWAKDNFSKGAKL